MRKIRIVATAALAALGAVSLPALAQVESTPRIDQRQENQRERIEQGLRSGQINRREARRLFEHEARIRRMEHRAMADGRMSRSERARIEQEQDLLSRQIARESNDREHREHRQYR